MTERELKAMEMLKVNMQTEWQKGRQCIEKKVTFDKMLRRKMRLNGYEQKINKKENDESGEAMRNLTETKKYHNYRQ